MGVIMSMPIHRTGRCRSRLPALPRTVRAASVQRQLVILDRETGRRELGIAVHAPLDIEHLAASPALKMMVVVLRRMSAFVPCVVAGQDHQLDAAGLQHHLQVSVDRGDPHAGDFHLRGLQHFLRRKRTASLVDGLLDGVALAGMTFHGFRGQRHNRPASQLTGKPAKGRIRADPHDETAGR